ncbi:hypothetical protein AB0L00_11170 [Actinoallomurus sp. NPDC052308]|uniref:hypothetical protein n=1 Tax=Actinoallomurus sp. NPDC052308 TaxID=3155530 RepID=UPI003421E31B
MGRRAELDLTFRVPVGLDQVLEELGSAGWIPVKDDEILYASGDYDWSFASSGHYAEVREDLKSTLANDDDAAISLWTAEGPGINLMFRPGMTRINVGLDLSRRTLDYSPELTDLPWYLSKLLPFARLGLVAVAARDEYEV